MAEMHEGERHFGQSNASRPERSPVRHSLNIVRNSILPIAAVGAAAMWSVAVARLTSPPDGGGDTWRVIHEMQVDPQKYPQFNRVFNLQDHLPANPEVSECHYFDSAVPWGKVIPDPKNPDRLKLVLCPPQYTKYFLIFPIE